MPVFLDDNSISASFPSIMVSAVSPFHRKPKHITITAPCSPITEAYSLEYMNQYTSNVTNVTDGNECEFQVLDMVSSNQSHTEQQTHSDIARDIILGMIRGVEREHNKQTEIDPQIQTNGSINTQTSECPTPRKVGCDGDDDDVVIW
eukprot:260275_1